MKKDYNDFKLVCKAKEGNEEVLELLLNKYQPVINYIARRKLKIALNLSLDFSDLYQEGMIGLITAINTFDESKNVTFYTFANLCINGKINTALSKNNRKRDKALNSSISLDKNVTESEQTLLDFIEQTNEITPLNKIIDKENKEELYTIIKENLSPFEKEVFDLKIKGYKYNEIKNILGVNKKKVYSAMRRIKEKIKKEIEI